MLIARETHSYLENNALIEDFNDYVIISGEKFDKYIECPICHKKMRQISNTHIWKAHRLTMEEFKNQFPNQNMDSPFSIYLKKHFNIFYKSIKEKDIMNDKVDTLQQTVKSTDYKHGHNIKSSDVDYFNYREKALSYYGEECSWCGETDTHQLVVHHKDNNNFRNNIISNNNLDNLVVLCHSCHNHVHSQEKDGFWEGKTEIEKGFAQIISGLYLAYGFDKDDINVRDTPSRVARAYLEMLQGIDPSKAESILKQNFPSNYDGMVVIAKIPCFSMCPHHFLPVKYEASFGYIPNGNVLGLSKIPRYIKTSVQAPVLQEDITEQIVERFSNIVKPLGCMVILKGNHMCMGCRGVEMPDTSTVTSAFRGNFEKQVVRDEFFTMIDFHK